MPLIVMIVSSVVQADDFERQQIQKRIKPVGQVKTQQEPAKEEPAKESQVVQKKHPGEATYKQFCAVCHAAGIAGAPKFRDKTMWKSRTDNKDLAQLTQSAIKGLNAMPPKGTCMNCSAEDMKQAIKYMLPNEK